MKCKTCRHWNDSQGFNLKAVQWDDIFPTSKIIPIPNQPKSKPDGKLITTPGIIVNGNATNVMTTSDWYCKNPQGIVLEELILRWKHIRRSIWKTLIEKDGPPVYNLQVILGMM